MATDYRFLLSCWQDSAGSENAKMNVWVNDTQVLTEHEITAISEASAQLVSFEATNLSDPNTDGSVTCNIKIELANEYYVDASTDRNIWINNLAYINKASSASDYVVKAAAPDSDLSVRNAGGPSVTTDFTNIDTYYDTNSTIPTAVVGDQLPDGFWDDAIANDAFYHIPVWAETVTITVPLKVSFTNTDPV